MNNPLVSIIIPVYNVEKYIEKCIDSIINQTYKNLEIILVDDGSPDGCPEICDKYALQDSRIKAIHKKNGGLSDARNAGLDIMKGEWVIFIDSDDFVSPYHVENLYYLVKKFNTNIAITSFECFYNENKKFIYKKITNEKVLIHTSKEAIENMFYNKFYKFYAWGKIYHKELFHNIRFPKGKIYEDLSTIPLILLNIDKVAFCDMKDYFYLQRKDSITGKIKEENFMIFDILSDLNDKFSDKDIKTALLCSNAINSLIFINKLDNIENVNNKKYLKNNVVSNIKTILLNKNFPLKVKIASLILYVFGTKTYLLTYSFFNLVKNKLK